MYGNTQLALSALDWNSLRSLFQVANNPEFAATAPRFMAWIAAVADWEGSRRNDLEGEFPVFAFAALDDNEAADVLLSASMLLGSALNLGPLSDCIYAIQSLATLSIVGRLQLRQIASNN